MQNDFNFCPNCGGKNIQNLNMRKWKCDDCGYTLYNNVAAAVGLVIQNAQGKILFEKRAKDPRKGFLALLTRTKLPKKLVSASAGKRLALSRFL